MSGGGYGGGFQGASGNTNFGMGGFRGGMTPAPKSQQGFGAYNSIFGSNPYSTGQQSVTYNPMGGGMQYQGPNTYKGDPTQTAGYNGQSASDGQPPIMDPNWQVQRPPAPTNGGPTYTLGNGAWTDYGLTDLGQQSNPVTAPPATQMQPPRQTLDQFAATLGNPGQYSQQQIQDMYDRQNAGTLQQANPNPGATAPNPGKVGYNVGTYGTTPQPQASWFPPQWGAQDMNFNPMSMAGKTVQPNQAWYYGYDSIGRQIGNNGQAFPTFGGTDNSLPWLRSGTYTPPWMGGK